MNVQFGYCTQWQPLPTKSEVEDACRSAIRSEQTHPFSALDGRLKNIETAVASIASRFNTVV